jgi:hypothetical protein
MNPWKDFKNFNKSLFRNFFYDFKRLTLLGKVLIIILLIICYIPVNLLVGALLVLGWIISTKPVSFVLFIGRKIRRKK